MHISLMLKEMNVGLCSVAQAHRLGKTCICVIFPHMYTQKIKGMMVMMILFVFHHNILSPYGQPSFWHGVTVKCVSPQQPTHIPPLIISKSRAAYALNIRLLCMVINPITHMDKCTTS